MKIVKEANTEKKFVRDVTGNTVFETLPDFAGPFVLAYESFEVKANYENVLCFNLAECLLETLNIDTEVKIYKNAKLILKTE